MRTHRLAQSVSDRVCPTDHRQHSIDQRNTGAIYSRLAIWTVFASNQLKEIQRKAWALLYKEYGTINTENVYPVEQFPYCDALAKEMSIMPTLGNVKSLRTWLKIMFTPASTTHYVDKYFDKQAIERQKVHTPVILLALLTLMRLLGYPLRLIKRIRNIKIL